MGRIKKHHIDFFEIVSSMYLLLIVFLVLVIAAQQNHSIFIVLLGFFPTILVISTSMVMHNHFADHKSWLWIIPIGINVIAYFIANATPTIAQTLDVDILTGANFLLSIIYIIVVSSIFLEDFKKKAPVQKQPEPSPKTLEDYVHSIEDKSKALNFVIGRVYSRYHGGSRDLRALLRIPSEWYNEFSLIGVGTETIDTNKLKELLERFEKQLQLYKKTEKEVFKYEHKNLKNLIRDPEGNDIILDVIDRNDKDPGRTYYEGAVEFCKIIKQEIKTDSLNLIKNEYIATEEKEPDQIKHP